MSTCARPGCDNALPPRRYGRPALYCCPACRPSRAPRPTGLRVEVDHPESSSDGRPAERIWTVALRRGQRVVVIAEGLGWPSANALAIQLEDLLTPRPRQRRVRVG